MESHVEILVEKCAVKWQVAHSNHRSLNIDLFIILIRRRLMRQLLLWLLLQKLLPLTNLPMLLPLTIPFQLAQLQLWLLPLLTIPLQIQFLLRLPLALLLRLLLALLLWLPLALLSQPQLWHLLPAINNNSTTRLLQLLRYKRNLRESKPLDQIIEIHSIRITWLLFDLHEKIFRCCLVFRRIIIFTKQ